MTYSYINKQKRGAVRVLVPGAGLGRLAFDIAKAGMQPIHNRSCKVLNGLVYSL